MAKSEIVSGLDIGSSQTVVVLGRRNEETGEILVLGGGRAPCRGLKGGVVVNIPESKLAISKAVEEAEEQGHSTAQNLLVAIRGSHIETFNHRGAINISRTDREITGEDVDQVVVNAKAIQLSSDREILHTVPQDFSVDKQAGVEDPVGMEGSHLSVDVHIAVASSNHVSNVVKAINLSGFTCEDLIYGTFAVGDSVISEEEKDLGVGLIDLGGQSTNLALYVDGSVRYTKELPIGGELITRDISYGLKTSFTQAQILKEKYGLASVQMISADEMIDYLAVDGHTQKQTSTHALVQIIQSRVEEIFELIHQELLKSNYAEMIPGGIVLTGGCSKLPGIDKLAESLFGVNVHVGYPLDVEGPKEIVQDPVFATAIGLLKYRHMGEWSGNNRKSGQGGLFRKMKDWMNEFL
ncbi:MAG: cell division protein FtsA [Elusimicrobia bacterium]|nr:cell division protein FtsA [Elusimicrobiota bacterium]MBI3012012.1 cell division protein FtsA [Elusimicrobiota bacterium]